VEIYSRAFLGPAFLLVKFFCNVLFFVGIAFLDGNSIGDNGKIVSIITVSNYGNSFL
jgi:hypothetical protein